VEREWKCDREVERECEKERGRKRESKATGRR
jgi:hypothetical protein